MEPLNVFNNEQRQQFQVQLEGELASLEYRMHEGMIVLMHTEVPEALGGRGIGSALAGYALLSLALFGRGVLRDGGVVGSFGGDQASFTWSLAWWPHALVHGLHPLLTDLVYAPDGSILRNATSAVAGQSIRARLATGSLRAIVLTNSADGSNP